MSVAVGRALPGGTPPLRAKSTADDATTVSLGVLVDVYRITAPDKTLTFSAVHLTVDGRLFEVVSTNGEDGTNFIAAEGGATVGGLAALPMTANGSSVLLRTLGGNLEVRST